jgi:glycosyltransferase involved in cell wall biosynthesis
MNITNKELISVGILTYNKYKSLKKILTNVVMQDYVNLEIIISDNSTENILPNKINKIITNDSRIKYYKHANNIGWLGNEKFVRLKFRGKYACILHDDDQIPIDYISILYKKMTTSANCGIAGFSCDRYYNNKFWYSYQKINTINLDQLNRLICLIKLIFCGGGTIEHFWNGLYKVNALPRNFRLPNKKESDIIIFFLFQLSIKSNLVSVEDNNKFIKHTNIQNIKNYNTLYKSEKISKFKIINSIYIRLKYIKKIFEIILFSKEIKLINKLKIFFFTIIYSIKKSSIKKPILPK